MTTPYALFEHVPLSECRNAWRVWHRPRRHDPRTGETWRKWSEHMHAIYCERALAAVTAERDALRRDYNDLLAERDALQFAATQAGRERDALLADLKGP